MTKWDKEYIKLCKKVLKEGIEVENRTGINSIKIEGYFFELDLAKEFPVLTTKQLYFRQAIIEMLWIYQAQSNDVRWLQKRDVHIWDKWKIDEDGKWRATQMVLDKNNKLVQQNIEKDFGIEMAHTIGTAYGFIANRYKFMENLISKLKTNPNDRRMIYTLWQDEFMPTAVLPSCVWSTEWNVVNDKLNLWVHQRSADIPLGLPFNVTQYAVLANLIAHCAGLKLGKMRYSINETHIYVNQIDGIKEQIDRYEKHGDLKAPKLWINPLQKDFFKIDNSKELKDIKIEGYEHLGAIKFPLAQ